MKIANINIKAYTRDKREKLILLQEAYESCLKHDPIWHFFCSDKTVTVRLLTKNVKRFTNFLKRRDCKYERGSDFDPKLDEHPTIKFIGDDLQPIFHEMAVAFVKYPENVLKAQVLERMIHIMCNMMAMEFDEEARLLADLALRRSWLDGNYARVAMREEI